MNEVNSVIACENLSKIYQDGELRTPVFSGINITIQKGETVAIIGASGAGKSTLLQLMGGLDKPTDGTVFVLGKNIATLSEAARCRLRNQQLGFVYQFHHLLAEFDALENVCMPLWIGKKYDATPAKQMLEKVGLAHRMHHRISELSGGERQRVAIARALVHQPACVLADEPTGNLDHVSAEAVFDLMLALNVNNQTSFVMVTHNEGLAKRCSRVLVLEKGSVREKT